MGIPVPRGAVNKEGSLLPANNQAVIAEDSHLVGFPQIGYGALAGPGSPAKEKPPFIHLDGTAVEVDAPAPAQEVHHEQLVQWILKGVNKDRFIAYFLEVGQVTVGPDEESPILKLASKDRHTVGDRPCGGGEGRGE